MFTLSSRTALSRSVALVAAGVLVVGGAGTVAGPAAAAPARADLSATCEGRDAHPFTDIADQPTDAQQAIACLFDYGVTAGTFTGRYSPDDAVSRQQMAIFVARQVGYVVATSELTRPAPVPVSGHSDRDELTTEGRTAVDLLTAMGVVTGNADGSYAGERAITRAEMAVFIDRVQDEIARQLGADAAYVAADADPTFDDVPADAFYADAVHGLQSVGIVEGVSLTEDLYDPGAAVLRSQMAFFIMRHVDENVVAGRVQSRAVTSTPPGGRPAA